MDSDDACRTPLNASLRVVMSLTDYRQQRTPAQARAALEYRRLSNRLRSETQEDILQPHILLELADLFDCMFLGVTLSKVRIGVKELLAGVDGITDIAFDEQHASIWLNSAIRQLAHHGSFAEAVESCLLHELIHAFFWEYCCHAQCADQECLRIWISQLGATGHQGAWDQVAAAIEQVWRDSEMSDYDLVLSRDTWYIQQGVSPPGPTADWQTAYKDAISGNSLL